MNSQARDILNHLKSGKGITPIDALHRAVFEATA